MWVAAAQCTRVPHTYSQTFVGKECDLSPESATLLRTYFQQLLTCRLTGSACAAQRKRLDSYTYLTGDDKEFGCTFWVRGIWYLEKQGEKSVISERRWLLQCCCKWEKHEAGFHCLVLELKRETAIQSKACQVWSYAVVCIIPKGQGSLPDWCKVTWTSFPSGLAPFPIHSLLWSSSTTADTISKLTLLGFPS